MEITRILSKHSMWINECDKMIYHGTEMEQETKNVFSFCLSECEWETKEIVLLLCRLITLSGQGSGDLIWGEGRGWKIPPLTESTLALPLPKNGPQPHISPRQRCFNRKTTKKLRVTCITRRLFWSVISTSCCSRQGPFWKVGCKRPVNSFTSLFLQHKNITKHNGRLNCGQGHG